jgi:transposase
MSQRERDVLKVLAGVLSGERTQVEAARLLRKSVRQVRRLVRRLERDGDAGIVHRLRGQPSNRRLDGSVREEVLTAYRRDYSDFGPTLASEKLAQGGFHVSSDTLRRWLLEAGLWQRKRQRAQHRRRRPRRECFGELVQMDTSIHEWLEGRGEAMVLVSMTDDATGRVLARFYEGETVEAHLDLLGRWLERYGRPVALYTDHDSIFESHAKGRRVEGSTQFSRALGELGIELILAGSPQAKGRVERLFGTLQDRWVKEMRLEQIATRAAANELLGHRLLDDHNRRFAKKPTSPNDAHRPLLAEHRLPAILSVQHQRTVTNDYCVRFANDIYQLAKPALPGLRGGKVTIELRLDGTMAIRFRDRYLAYHGLGALPPDPRSLALSQHPAERETGEADGSAPPSAVTLTAGRSGRTPAEPYPPDGTPQPKKTAPYRPPVNHPWRRKFLTK